MFYLGMKTGKQKYNNFFLSLFRDAKKIQRTEYLKKSVSYILGEKNQMLQSKVFFKA